VDPEQPAMTEIEHDLKATAEDLAADAERVRDIEQQKAALPVTDPGLATLSAESEALTLQMAEKARAEAALVSEAQSRRRPN
jgi:hypothetical protein